MLMGKQDRRKPRILFQTAVERPQRDWSKNTPAGPQKASKVTAAGPSAGPFHPEPPRGWGGATCSHPGRSDRQETHEGGGLGSSPLLAAPSPG